MPTKQVTKTVKKSSPAKKPKTAPKVTNSSKATAVKSKMTTRNIVIIAVAAVVLLFIGLIALTNSATSGVTKVSNELVDAIQQGDADTAYELFSSAAQEATSTEDFEAIVDRISPIIQAEPKMTDKSISGETGSAASGQVIYEIEGTDGNTYQFTVNLTKENDVWKVLNFDSSKE